MGQVMLGLMSSIGWSFGKLIEQEKVIAPAREAAEQSDDITMMGIRYWG